MSDESLISFIESVSGDAHLRVEENLGDGFVRLRTAEAERRQAKHDIRSVEDIVIEMLRNARDADANSIFLATTREGDMRTMTFLDDGNGVPKNLQDRIFEPRVTSKLETMVMDTWGVHGRGMALYSIRSNAQRAQVVSSDTDLGSAFLVSVDLDDLTEKTDQSTYPVLEKDDEGALRVVRGPHNIIRCMLEFSLEHRHDLDIYLGSPAEIASTLCEYGRRHLKTDSLLFCDDIDTLPVCERLAACADAIELMEKCQSLGLGISERTAHRILSGQIAPQKAILAKVVPTRTAKPITNADLYRDSRGLKVAKEDIESFSRDMEKAFEPLAERYYLSLKDMPKITVSKDCIRVRFDIDKDL